MKSVRPTVEAGRPQKSRRFVAVGLISAVVACGSDVVDPFADVPGDAALTARPGTVLETLGPGKHDLDLAVLRDGFIYIPQGHDAEAPAPLLMLLHGATGAADNWEAAFALADSLGIVLMAPDSRGRTWDLITRGGYGPDVAFIDRALEKTFERVRVDPSRIGAAGFSDGASYALSLGLSNGDLFTHIIAWSPGFSAPKDEQGRPLVFVSHGSSDGILSVETTRTRIVPGLQDAGYSVHYEEFDGGHVIPAAIARQALDWFLSG